jgi:uncharacterized repeat protein (TIGR03803 family)
MQRLYRFGTIFTLIGASALASASDASIVRPPSETRANVHKETVLFSLTGGTHGANPGGLVLLRDGTIVASAQNGGAACPQASGGCGLIFKLTPASNGYQQSILHVFHGGADGATPRNIVADAAGNLYGTTDLGGNARSASCPNGCGTIYKLSPTARGYHESIIYRFHGDAEGYLPSAGGVFVDAAGSIYGQTSLGGTPACGCGTIYRLTPTTGGYQRMTIHAFAGPPNDGAAPQSALAENDRGVLYGTTSSGGSCAGGNCGVVFSAALNGGTYTYRVIHAFEGPPADGFNPEFGVVAEPDGTLVGATNGGGTNHQGVTYRLRPTGARYEVSTVFNGINGANPRFLTPGDGVIYGSAFGGGSVNEGLVYALHAGVETVLYAFSGGADGANPTALAAGRSHAVYGVTNAGGDATCECGVVFRVTR